MRKGSEMDVRYKRVEGGCSNCSDCRNPSLGLRDGEDPCEARGIPQKVSSHAARRSLPVRKGRAT
jgi:hypothetical protein